MSDIFNEVDEEVKKEQYSRLWKRFAPFVYATAALIVVGTAGYRGYQYWEQQRSQAAGTEFMEAVKLSEAGDYAGAELGFATLSDKIGGYPMLAKFRSAADKAAQGETSEAIALLDQVAKDSSVDPVYQGLANVRAAYIQLNSGDLAGAKNRASGMTMAGNPWRFAALEVVGAVDYQDGKLADAKARFEEIANDAAVSQNFANRARMYLDLIAAAQGADKKDSTE